jgi:hypothetical protein
MTSHKSSQPKKPRRKYGKESETYMRKDNYTTSKRITTENGITQFSKQAQMGTTQVISGR